MTFSIVFWYPGLFVRAYENLAHSLVETWKWTYRLGGREGKGVDERMSYSTMANDPLFTKKKDATCGNECLAALTFGRETDRAVTTKWSNRKFLKKDDTLLV